MWYIQASQKAELIELRRIVEETTEQLKVLDRQKQLSLVVGWDHVMVLPDVLVVGMTTPNQYK